MCIIQFVVNLAKISIRHNRYYSSFAQSNLKATLLNMPRERQNNNNRAQKKEKTTSYVPGTITLQVLGSGALGSPAVLYLFTDQNRYLFNCGEGTQRLAHEYKNKLSRLEHVFFTRRCWHRMGGLPGLSLTLQEAGIQSLHLHGPPDINELFTATKRFVVLRDLKIYTVEAKAGEVFEDSVMVVHYVPLFSSTKSNSKPSSPKGMKQFSKKNSSLLDNEANTSNVDSLAESSVNRRNLRSSSMPADETDYYAHERSGTRTDPVAMSQLLNLEEKIETEVTAYICRLKPKPGALCLERCVKLGIKPGPIFGQLKDGIDVTLPDGRVIKSSDVRGPDDPGPVFIVLDIPSEDYLTALENNEEFTKHQASATKDEDAAYAVFHYTPQHIMNNPRYVSFMEKFSPSTIHVVLNEQNEFLCSPSVQRLQFQLNQLDSHIFPLLVRNMNSYKKDNSENRFNSPVRKKLKTIHEDTQASTTEFAKLNCHDDLQSSVIRENVNTMSCFHLRPKRGCDRSNEPVITPEAYIEETSQIEGFHESLCELKNDLTELEKSTIKNSNFPRVIFLGTGSCIPNKTRNTSAILVQLSDSNNILLDCGEGTFGQFVRHFTEPGELHRVLKNLRLIYVSHLHADHHIGLIGLLQERQKLLSQEQSIPEIKLLAPSQISSWLEFFNKRFEKISDTYELIPNQMLMENASMSVQEELVDFTEYGLESINTCLVKHCPHAFGIALYTNDGYKITYSGDTMPCDDLVQLGMDSDLLIHEATMEDDLIGEAKFKLHSTLSQAIGVGNAMRAKRILLTHFSQRYAKIPRIQNLEDLKNVGLAFDHMQLVLHDFYKLPIMHKCLKTMFSEHCEELEERAAKRALKKQLKAASRSPTPV